MRGNSKSKRLKSVKRILHEDYIDKLHKRGISRKVIYKNISETLGYSFHCADLTISSDLDNILNVVKSVSERLDVEYSNY